MFLGLVGGVETTSALSRFSAFLEDFAEIIGWATDFFFFFLISGTSLESLT